MTTRTIAAAAAVACLATVPAGARADVFNGRIAFSSFRTDPTGRSSMRRMRTGSGPMWNAMACWCSARSDWVERLR